MRVLVLDDDYRDISPILRHMFPEDEFTFVDTPRSAEKELDSNAFDLVLLDGSLGLGIYGPEVLKRWRSTRALPPVYMISGDPVLNKEGLSEGAMGAIDKVDLSIGYDAARKQLLQLKENPSQP